MKSFFALILLAMLTDFAAIWVAFSLFLFAATMSNDLVMANLGLGFLALTVLNLGLMLTVTVPELRSKALTAKTGYIGNGLLAVLGLVLSLHVSLIQPVLFFVAVAALHVAALRRARCFEIPAGCCTECGYDLTGLPSTVCPECGHNA